MPVNSKLDTPCIEQFGAFTVVQLARDTELEPLLGADVVTIQRHTSTEIHRHNLADNVIYILSGVAVMILEGERFEISQSQRIRIAKGACHGFITANTELTFISIQCPPILIKGSGYHDVENCVT